MTQLDLFSAKRSNDRKQRGQKAVLDNENEEWKEQTLMIIYRLASTQKEFTFDDVRASAKRACYAPPHHPNVWGSLMRAASFKGWIKKTDRVKKSTLVSSHSRTISIWESCL